MIRGLRVASGLRFHRVIDRNQQMIFERVVCRKHRQRNVPSLQAMKKSAVLIALLQNKCMLVDFKSDGTAVRIPFPLGA